jgi:hypothetical protein
MDPSTVTPGRSHSPRTANAAQPIEPLGWAIADAENTQRTEQAL